jgi:cob(I)alamin adenosyltransferase
MKIYTKKGDEGKTSLIGGTRVPKHHIRIEAYGTVDELNSWVGLLRDQKECARQLDTLLEIQDRLFTIGSQLASDPVNSRMKIPELATSDISLLEKEIDKMDEELPEMRSFILPGGSEAVSFCHITRCVCRRAERQIVHLDEHEKTGALIIPYMNRLSDYFFVLSRWITQTNAVRETPWKARL